MQDREWEIDFVRILGALRRSALCILALAAEGALAAFLGTLLLTTPQYRSTVMFHGQGNVSAGSCRMILQSQETMETILAFSGVGKTCEEAAEMIRFTPLDPETFFEVSVTGSDPQEAELIADAVATVLPVRIGDVIKGTSADPVNYTVGAARAVDPGSGRNALLGAAAGLLLGFGVACVDGVVDPTVRSEKDLKKICPYPILATLSKGHCEGSKLLRAKLEHLLAGKSSAHVLGITSPLPGEGKDSLAEHLVLSLKKQGRRVILVHCDPVSGKGDARAQSMGLADYLAGRGELGQVIQHHALEKEQFVVIPPGQAGKHLAELLSGGKMAELLQKFRGGYEYVILNLPVMAEAGDVLPLAEKLDGIVLCVQRDVCNAGALGFALEQLEFVEANILGLVYQDFGPVEKSKCSPANQLAAGGHTLFLLDKKERQMRHIS